MKIYIGFSKPTSFLPIFGWFIEWIESRPYDHIYIRFQSPKTNRFLIFQASNLQVNLYNSDIFKNKHFIIKEYELEINENHYVLLWETIELLLGTPYSLKEDFGILLMKIFHLKNNPFNDGIKAEFCSKLAAFICQLMGIILNNNPDSIDPSALDELLKQNNLICIENPKF